ncbi:MAG: hypothetical protein IJP75_10635 [Bacteroidaceae bacterium]|nr:hypothetical protein [Bacteroidaceae bacterium]
MGTQPGEGEEQKGDEEAGRGTEDRQREEEEGGEDSQHLQMGHLLPHQRGAERICTLQPSCDGLQHGRLIREAASIESCLNWFHNQSLEFSIKGKKTAAHSRVAKLQ